MSPEYDHGVRVAEITAGLVPRLRKICAHLSADEFNELVDSIAQLQARFERKNGEDGRYRREP